MPNENVVDSTVGNAAVDSAAEQENHAAAGSSAKTFTEAEVDARIKARIDKQNEKHRNEVASIESRVAELEEQLSQERERIAEYERTASVNAWKAEASKQTGVPSEILRGSTEEEIKAHAEAIAAAIPAVPVVRDSGESRRPPKGNADLFADFMNRAFNS